MITIGYCKAPKSNVFPAKRNGVNSIGSSEIYPRLYVYCFCGSGSVVDIATAYGLDGPGIECRWRRDFPHLSRPALRPTQPPVNGYRVLPGGKMRPGRDADPSPLPVPK
jgi:hypothetical protein